MTRNEAISFLQAHQPMPPDELLTQELIDEYDSVVKFFKEYPEKEAIPLLLRSFGEWDCYGVYEMVKFALFKCVVEDVVLSLKVVLEDYSVPESVRYWATLLAGDFPDSRL